MSNMKMGLHEQDVDNYSVKYFPESLRYDIREQTKFIRRTPGSMSLMGYERGPRNYQAFPYIWHILQNDKQDILEALMTEL